MEPLLLFSERERRADRRAKGIIVAVFSAICYALLWKWDYLGGSPWRVAVIVAVPLVFCLLAIVNNPVELTVACVIVVSLVAVGLPAYKHAREKRRKIEELQQQRRLHVEEKVSAAHWKREQEGRVRVTYDGLRIGNSPVVQEVSVQ